MPRRAASEPIKIRTAKVTEIYALANAMDHSRSYVVNRAIEQYLEANTWQIEHIKAGIIAALEGKVLPADEVFAGIAAKRGWVR